MSTEVNTSNSPLRNLPAVDGLLKRESVQTLICEHGPGRVALWARESTDRLRRDLLEHPRAVDKQELAEQAESMIHDLAQREAMVRLGRVINATGVVLHTNLGRAPLAERAIEAVAMAAHYGNLEIDLATGKRRYRGYQIDSLWRELTGAEASLVVNNCASATILALRVLASGREVVVCRGQLIEIGGSFRLPDVFVESGAILREVGTTNRCRLSDYSEAIGPETAALLHVHPSNFHVVGFTESVDIGPLAELAHSRGLVVIDDIGSGALVDLRRHGLPKEPTIGESLAAGADLVLFSGDKLLGGPQCGMILGKSELIEPIRKSPLARAMRIDKLTLAALQATLEIHLAGRSLEEIPVLRQLTLSIEEIRRRAEELLAKAQKTKISFEMVIRESRSAVGGGSLPTAELPTWVVAILPGSQSADDIARRLRQSQPPVLARVEEDAVLLDPRTLLPGEESMLLEALRNL